MNGHDNFTEAEDDWTVGARTPRTDLDPGLEDLHIESASRVGSGKPGQNTHLTGITFETPSKGRQVCLYYQNDRDEVVQAHLRWDANHGTWEKVGRVEGLRVCGPSAHSVSRPKRNSPLAAVSWGNGKFIWVFYVEREWGMLVEMVSSDGGETWLPGSLYRVGLGPRRRGESPFVTNLHVPVRANGGVAAALSRTGLAGLSIALWYQDGDNKIRQLVWEHSGEGEGKWRDGYISGEKGYGGTSLACMRSEDGLQEWVYYQGFDERIVERFKNSGGVWENHPFKETYPTQTPMTALLAYPPGDPRIYLKSTQNNIVQEWYTNFGWQERKILPLSNYIIKNKFVALNWALDRGATEIHIFSVDSAECGHSKVYAYVVGEVPAAIEVTIED